MNCCDFVMKDPRIAFISNYPHNGLGKMVCYPHSFAREGFIKESFSKGLIIHQWNPIQVEAREEQFLHAPNDRALDKKVVSGLPHAKEKHTLVIHLYPFR